MDKIKRWWQRSFGAGVTPIGIKASHPMRGTNYNPLDFRASHSDPVQAFEDAGRQSVLVDMPLSDLRGFTYMAFSLNQNGFHPLVLAAKAYVDEHSMKYEGSPLQAYYKEVCPATLAEVLDIPPNDLPWLLRRVSPLWADLPWRNAPGFHVRRRRVKTMRRDARQYGVSIKVTGSNYVGPVDPELGKLEWQRVCRLVSSIRERGYQPPASIKPIGGAVLVSGDKRVMVVKGGQHRAAALAALGYDTIPVMVRRDAGVVHRDSVGTWPAVTKGVLSEQQALAVFDRVFEGTPPKCTETFITQYAG